MSIAVVVEEKIKAGQARAYADYMKEMVALTKEEDGCIAYDLYEDADGLGQVVMIEIWESKEKLEAHMKTEHFLKFIPGGEAYSYDKNKVRIFNKL